MKKRHSKRVLANQSPMSVALSPVTNVITRREWLVVAFMISLGTCLRLASWNLTTVEHFDEGVYASNLWFGEIDGFRYPQQHLYAPPLVPSIIEWCMILSGRISGHAAIWPSVIAGIGTIALVWWVGRRILGSAGGFVAGTLAACSGTHVLMSRAALTDAMLLWWFVLAMLLFERACRTLRWRDFVLFGLAVGLAWWTKYNGWLPLFVGAASLVIGFILRPVIRNRVWPLCIGWCVAAAIALAMWSPHLLSLQSYGGYSTVAANHRQYIVGISGWWSSLTRQLANLAYINTWGNADLLSLVLGTGGTVILFCRIWGSPTDRMSGESAPQSFNAGNGKFVVAIWFTALAVLTPLYTPYPRLLLPWLAASWIASGAFVGTILQRIAKKQRQIKDETPGATAGLPSRGEAREGKPPAAPARHIESNTPVASAKTAHGSTSTQTIATALCIGLVGLATYVSGRSWSDRRGLDEVAQGIASTVTESARLTNPAASVVYVYGEPALLFHLRAAGLEPVVPIQTVELEPSTANGSPVPSFLVVGPHALRDRAFQADWPEAERRYEHVGSFAYKPSTLVALDNYEPRKLAGRSLTETIRLFRIK